MENVHEIIGLPADTARQLFDSIIADITAGATFTSKLSELKEKVLRNRITTSEYTWCVYVMGCIAGECIVREHINP